MDNLWKMFYYLIFIVHLFLTLLGVSYLEEELLGGWVIIMLNVVGVTIEIQALLEDDMKIKKFKKL